MNGIDRFSLTHLTMKFLVNTILLEYFKTKLTLRELTVMVSKLISSTTIVITIIFLGFSGIQEQQA